MNTVAAALLLLFASLVPALAVTPSEMLPDPAQEARARAISAELRCLVCQNQSIDDSDADLAHDLRVVVRDRIKAGDSDTAVLDYVVARYGEFVLLRPRFNLRNAALWIAPLAILAGGLGYAAYAAVSRRKAVAPLSEAEEADLQRVLGATPSDGSSRAS